MGPILQFSTSDYVRWTGQLSLFFVRVEGQIQSRLQTKSLFSEDVYLCQRLQPCSQKEICSAMHICYRWLILATIYCIYLYFNLAFLCQNRASKPSNIPNGQCEFSIWLQSLQYLWLQCRLIRLSFTVTESVALVANACIFMVTLHFFFHAHFYFKIRSLSYQ